LCVSAAEPAFAAHGFKQVNLLSDVSGQAPKTDSNLVNPWGLAVGDDTPIWIADNGTGVSTLVDGKGKLQPKQNHPLVVSIPAAASNTEGPKPDGLVYSPDDDVFIITDGTNSGHADFMFAAEDGTISAWSEDVNPSQALLVIDRSGDGASYKGLAVGTTPNGDRLYATNFASGMIDMFDDSFHYLGSFTDPNVDAGFAPFGASVLGDTLYVTFALRGDDGDDIAGAGNGFVDAFDLSGTLEKRLVSHGALDSPWGLAIAPSSFGEFAGKLLVGNFGDGHINVYDPASGAALGALSDKHGTAIVIDGLWALAIGAGTKDGGRADVVYFTAGSDHEQHGLFGYLKARP
jgi:uncharacterized protein (TIGR03118 family)